MDFSAGLAAAGKALILPPAGLLLLYAAGAWVARRRPRLGRWICHGAVLVLYALSTGTGAWLMAHRLESLEPPLTSAATARGQAIVVLSAGRTKHSPEYGAAVPDYVALKRMAYGADLARKTGLPLLVTGGVISEKPNDEALALGMKRVFETSFGLPVRWCETASTNTAENASMSALMLKRDGVSRIILVTDAMHMRRARIEFERTGLAVTSGPTFYVASSDFNPFDLAPSAENLRRSYYAVYEWLGLARTALR